MHTHGIACVYNIYTYVNYYITYVAMDVGINHSPLNPLASIRIPLFGMEKMDVIFDARILKIVNTRRPTREIYFFFFYMRSEKLSFGLESACFVKNYNQNKMHRTVYS